jgi:hypothetical protein
MLRTPYVLLGLLAVPAAFADSQPVEAVGAMCAGPLWTNGLVCPTQPIKATKSAGSPATTVVDFKAAPATLSALAFDWRINGDENRNARVEVSYRRSGEQAWKSAQPLHRLQNERVNLNDVPPLRYVVPNMFSGSILDLQPDTAYEVRLALGDPDGVTGTAEQNVTARTRAEPRPAAGGKVYHVYPFGYKGTKQEPAFMGLNAAYYLEGWRHADWSNVSAPRVQPGDTILVHAGVYKDVRTEYGTNPDRPSLGTPFDGTHYLTQSGTAEKPIVIKAAGDGEVVFDGDGNFNLFNLLAGSHHYFEGITVRNTEIAFLLGLKNIAGSSGFTLKHSKLEDVGRGVMTDWGGSRNFYIADNTFIGRHDQTKLLGWGRNSVFAKLPGFPEKISGAGGSEYAVKVYGQGHVVAHNTVSFFHDGIDIASYADPDGAPDEYPDRIPVSIDIQDNDIFAMGDNCIEADGGARNIRVMRNRCFNQAGGALSAQPLFGGPVYFLRNVVYGGVGGSLKFSINPAGVLVYHNTFITDTNRTNLASNVHFRNNLILSNDNEGPTFSVDTLTSYSTSDYNGFRPGPGVAQPFGWKAPDFAERKFASLADYSRATKQDSHSVLVEFDSFEKASAPDGADPTRLYKPQDYDLRLKARSRAVNAGIAIANVNDGFTGRAPDLGAYERDKPLPQYGRRE